MLLLKIACLSRVMCSKGHLASWTYTFHMQHKQHYVNSDNMSIHTAGLPGENQAIHDDILEGRFAKERCGEHQQGVEPTSQDPKSGLPSVYWVHTYI